MKVKTTILAPLFLWIGFFPVYADESMAESIIVQQQVKGIRISGTVLDKEKSPLPGVNVTVKNEPGGAITDVDGHFYIEVPNKQSVLNITYIALAEASFKTEKDSISAGSRSFKLRSTPSTNTNGEVFPLKDASASAMYGVRGANGVIIINTKRGTIAAPSVNVRVNSYIQQLQ